jgi:4-hydroxy-tetrahydrodipicolinate synthase
VIAGVAEFTTAFAQKMAKEAERVGVDGIMVMPALVYSSKPHETAAHFRSVATATDLPIMVYNNPPIYKNDVTPDILATLTDCDNIVCFKDSSGDTRRFIDLRNTVGDRFVLFAGLDDVVVESIAVGAEGWISGMSNAFPREGETLFRLARQQRYEEAMALYRWFMPLLHLDARPDLVQCIKLCEELLGRGSAITRPPRLALEGETRAAGGGDRGTGAGDSSTAAGRRPLRKGVTMTASLSRRAGSLSPDAALQAVRRRCRACGR